MSFRRYEILLPTVTHGRWIHEGKTYEESHRKVIVDVEDTPEAEAFFVELK